MEIKFQITEEDYIKFNLYHIENSPSHKCINKIHLFKGKEAARPVTDIRIIRNLYHTFLFLYKEGKRCPF